MTRGKAETRKEEPMTKRRSNGPSRVEETPAPAGQSAADPTQALLDRFRRDFANLAEKVDRDFEALHSAVTTIPDVPHATPPGATAPPVDTAELRAMLRTAVAEEIASKRGRELIGEVLQERFRGAAEQLRAQQQQTASPLQKLRSVASHKRP